MKLAFYLFNYFPYGGLQRDFLRIAKECVKRGHKVDVYTMAWKGEKDPSLSITVVPVKGWQNHTRCQHFIEKMRENKAYDLIIGFNKMPGLDIYYAADTCYQAKAKIQRSFWYRLTPRYRQLIQNEKDVFDAKQNTHILLIAHQQKKEFQKFYHTPDERFHLLPPGIAKERMAPSNASAIRQRLRREWQLSSDDILLLMVGSGFKTKGLDRCLEGIAAMPDKLKNLIHFYVIGDDNPTKYMKLAKKLSISQHVKYLGGRDNVADFMLAADLLLHPAYNENTGTVLLEAIIAGLPVLTTDVCGYAEYVQKAQAGCVLSSPFKQSEFNQTLENMLSTLNHSKWQQNGLAFGRIADIYAMPERAVDIIESL
jgi:UDP-glucose:(heptosyl)LPS alpha-1,3-glucosyltransferase